jgi:hypothetical protein
METISILNIPPLRDGVRRRLIEFSLILSILSNSGSVQAETNKEDFKKLVLEDCDHAIEASLDLADQELKEIIPYLLRVVHLGFAEAEQETVAVAPGVVGDRPYRGLIGEDFVRTYRREQESVTRRCALKVLVTLRPHSFRIIPGLIEQYQRDIVSVVDPRFQQLVASGIMRIVDEVRRLKSPVDSKFFDELLQIYSQEHQDLIQRVFYQLRYAAVDFLKAKLLSSSGDEQQKVFSLVKATVSDETELSHYILENVTKAPEELRESLLDFVISSLRVGPESLNLALDLYLGDSQELRPLALAVSRKAVKDKGVHLALPNDLARRLLTKFRDETQSRGQIHLVLEQLLVMQPDLQSDLVKLTLESTDSEMKREVLSLLNVLPALGESGRRLFAESIKDEKNRKLRRHALRLVAPSSSTHQDLVNLLSDFLIAQTAKSTDRLSEESAFALEALAHSIEINPKLSLPTKLVDPLATLVESWVREPLPRSRRRDSLIAPAFLLAAMEQRSRKAVFSLFSSSEPHVLEQAAFLLGYYYPLKKEEMQKLIALLSNQSSVVRRAAYQTLIRKGQAAVPYLKKFIAEEAKNAPEEAEELAAQAIYSLDPSVQEIVPIFRRKLHQECDRRVFFALDLMKLVPELEGRYRDGVINCFADPNFTRHRETLNNLAQRGTLPEKNQKTLISAIMSRQDPISLKLKEQLFFLSEDLGIPQYRLQPVAKQLLTTAQTRSLVLNSLRRRGLEAFIFRDILQNTVSQLEQNTDEWLEVLVSLAVIDPQHLGFYQPLMERIEDDARRREAAYYLSLLPLQRRLSILISLLEHEREELRLFGLERLSELERLAAETGPVVISLLEDHSALVRNGALITMLNVVPETVQERKLLEEALLGKLTFYPASLEYLRSPALQAFSALISDEAAPTEARSQAQALMSIVESSIYRQSDQLDAES